MKKIKTETSRITNQFLFTYLPSSLKNQNNDNDNSKMNDNNMK